MSKIQIYQFALVGLILLSACAPFFRFGAGPQTYAVALGDLDGDGDLDAFLANGDWEVPFPNTVWLNDGSGDFSDSGQRIGEEESYKVQLADVDFDGDLDAIVANTLGVSVYTNKGTGTFGGRRGFFSKDRASYVDAIAVGDLNGDGYVDVFGGGCCGEVEVWDDNRSLAHPPVDILWLSDGKGWLADSGQTFDLYGTTAIALGDLDGDGDLDAFFGNSSSNMDQTENFIRYQPDTIWFNDGHGIFQLGGQQLGTAEASAVALGDLDKDGDLDAFVGNQKQDEIWINLGGSQGGKPGTFRLSGTVGDDVGTRSMELADLDGDGDLDALVVYKDDALIWLNDGAARFTVGQQFTFKAQHALALGDLNGDGRVDVFAGSVDHGILIWFNDGSGKFIMQ